MLVPPPEDRRPFLQAILDPRLTTTTYPTLSHISNVQKHMVGLLCAVNTLLIRKFDKFGEKYYW